MTTVTEGKPMSSRQKEYRVVWEVDVAADSAREAAEIASEIQRGQTERGRFRGFFEVWDEDGERTSIDFEEAEEDDG